METKELWQNACSQLKGILNEDIFLRWISIINPVSYDGNKLVLGVNNDFTRVWLVDNYLGLIKSIVELKAGAKTDVDIVVVEAEEPPVENNPVADTPSIAFDQPAAPIFKPSFAKRNKKSQVIGSLNSQFTFDEFVVGPSNSFAYAAADAVAKAPGRAYNPLFIYGGTGLGKTHLMQAVGNKVLEQPSKTVAYVSSETFLNEYISSIQNNTPIDFQNRYRNVDVLLIDDIQFIAGKNQIQQQFFHTFNALQNERKQIIITSDKPPSEISGLEERLVSRFNAGLTTEMESPNFETRLAILRYKQAHAEHPLEENILNFIAENVKSNVRALEGAMNQVIVRKSLDNEPMTDEKLRYVLRSLLEKEQRDDIDLDKIQSVVADFFNIKLSDIMSDGRQQSIAMPRQIAMFLCRKLTHSSYPHIGEAFDKTHATVLHACNTIQGRLTIDQKLRANIRTIVENLSLDPRDFEL